MDTATIDKLISLNIQMEGVLRVLKERQSPEAADTFYALVDSFNALLNVEPKQPESQPEPVAKDFDVVAEEEEIDTPETIQQEDEVAEEEPEAEPEVEAEPEEEAAESAPDEPTAPHPVHFVPQETSHMPTIQSELRVDEMIMRRDARELRKAFTLNDKFRFRRELFGNNDVQFAETLNMLEAMNSMEEANLYLTDDLGWDPENEHVKDFIAIVENHFANF